jgi:hypothetical protein
MASKKQKKSERFTHKKFVIYFAVIKMKPKKVDQKRTAGQYLNIF